MIPNRLTRPKIELNPCYCSNKVPNLGDNDDNADMQYCYECGTCNASTRWHESDGQAADEWNRIFPVLNHCACGKHNKPTLGQEYGNRQGPMVFLKCLNCQKATRSYLDLKGAIDEWQSYPTGYTVERCVCTAMPSYVRYDGDGKNASGLFECECGISETTDRHVTYKQAVDAWNAMIALIRMKQWQDPSTAPLNQPVLIECQGSVEIGVFNDRYWVVVDVDSDHRIITPPDQITGWQPLPTPRGQRHG